MNNERNSSVIIKLIKCFKKINKISELFNYAKLNKKLVFTINELKQVNRIFQINNLLIELLKTDERFYIDNDHIIIDWLDKGGIIQQLYKVCLPNTYGPDLRNPILNMLDFEKILHQFLNSFSISLNSNNEIFDLNLIIKYILSKWNKMKLAKLISSKETKYIIFTNVSEKIFMDSFEKNNV